MNFGSRVTLYHAQRTMWLIVLPYTHTIDRLAASFMSTMLIIPYPNLIFPQFIDWTEPNYVFLFTVIFSIHSCYATHKYFLKIDKFISFRFITILSSVDQYSDVTIQSNRHECGGSQWILHRTKPVDWNHFLSYLLCYHYVFPWQYKPCLIDHIYLTFCQILQIVHRGFKETLKSMSTFYLFIES